jgi:hypothetical protein
LIYSRAETGRILLTATGRQGITADDRAYLVRLVASKTGIAPPDAKHRVDIAITAASTAVQKARRSAAIVGFSRLPRYCSEPPQHGTQPPPVAAIETTPPGL